MKLRKRKLTLINLLGLSALILAIACYFVVHVVRERTYRRLDAGLHAIQLSVERYAVDTEGSYPKSVDDLILRKFITEWPANPHKRGTAMIPLKPGDTPIPGGFIYLASGPIVSPAAVKKYQDDPDAMVELGSSASPPEIQKYVSDYDSYILIAYGPRLKASINQSGHNDYVKHNGSVITFAGAAGTTYLCAPGIDWNKVNIMLTSGEDYVSGCR